MWTCFHLGRNAPLGGTVGSCSTSAPPAQEPRDWSPELLPGASPAGDMLEVPDPWGSRPCTRPSGPMEPMCRGDVSVFRVRALSPVRSALTTPDTWADVRGARTALQAVSGGLPAAVLATSSGRWAESPPPDKQRLGDWLVSPSRGWDGGEKGLPAGGAAATGRGRAWVAGNPDGPGGCRKRKVPKRCERKALFLDLGTRSQTLKSSKSGGSGHRPGGSL